MHCASGRVPGRRPPQWRRRQRKPRLVLNQGQGGRSLDGRDERWWRHLALESAIGCDRRGHRQGESPAPVHWNQLAEAPGRHPRRRSHRPSTRSGRTGMVRGPAAAAQRDELRKGLLLLPGALGATPRISAKNSDDTPHARAKLQRTPAGGDQGEKDQFKALQPAARNDLAG